MFGDKKSRVCVKEYYPGVYNPYTKTSTGGGFSCTWYDYETDDLIFCEYSKNMQRRSECKKKRSKWLKNWSNEQCTRCKWECAYNLTLDPRNYSIRAFIFSHLKSGGGNQLFEFGECIWSCEVQRDQNFGYE